MLIKFANTDVEAWKVRQGVVVAVDDEFGNTVYGHVAAMSRSKVETNCFYIVVVEDNRSWTKFSRHCTWLEPH